MARPTQAKRQLNQNEIDKIRKTWFEYKFDFVHIRNKTTNKLPIGSIAFIFNVQIGPESVLLKMDVIKTTK